jgi:hypothetical protein
MRLARLGLIGAVLLVALHALLFASGDDHHSDLLPITSTTEQSVHQGDDAGADAGCPDPDRSAR